MTDSELLPFPWTSLWRAFEPDGSLGDLYVLNVDLSNWQEALDWLVSLGNSGLARLESSPEALALDVATLKEARPRTGVDLHIHIDGVQINSHFFDDSEIEFDIDPREIDRPSRARIVIDFMRGLAAATRREVYLTEENDSSRPLLTYESASDRWTFTPPEAEGKAQAPRPRNGNRLLGDLAVGWLSVRGCHPNEAGVEIR